MTESNHYPNSRPARPSQARRQPAEKVQAGITLGQRFPLTIKRLGINGEGIGYYKHVIPYVKGGLPGEVMVEEVTTVHPL